MANNVYFSGKYIQENAKDVSSTRIEKDSTAFIRHIIIERCVVASDADRLFRHLTKLNAHVRIFHFSCQRFQIEYDTIAARRGRRQRRGVDGFQPKGIFRN